MLTKYKNILLFIGISIFTSSCSTLNKEECKTANWKTIGYEDGTKGYPASRIGQHRSACAEYGVRPNLDAYTAGRNQGLIHYCVPNIGYKKGLYGHSYNGVCTNHSEKIFLDAYNYGIKIYKQKVILSKMKDDYLNNENYILSLENEIHEKEHEIVSGRLSKHKALTLLNETRDMAEELGRVKSNLYLLQEDISRQSEHINYLINNSDYH